MEKQKVIIRGGKALTGEIPIESNKNAVLPVLCATLLTKELCTMHNVPKSPDVLKVLSAIVMMQGICMWEGSTLTVNCRNIVSQPVDECVSDIQSAILFVGPLLARFGVANVPVAIGCKLGYRGPEDHIKYLAPFGVTCSTSEGRVNFSIDINNLKDHALVKTSYFSEILTKSFLFSEASVTPTENLLMFLSGVTKFSSEIQGIAQEPHVQFLVSVLKKMGCSIQGKGSTLVTGGTSRIRGFECDFAEEPDFVDFYGTAVMVALTQGNVLLKCLVTPAIRHMVEFLADSGIHCTLSKEGVRVDGEKSKFIPTPGFSKANEQIWKLNPKPWPGFPIDCLPSFIAWSCTNSKKGTGTTINNWMYEDGLAYVPQILKMSAAEIHQYPTEFGSQKITVMGTGSEEYFECTKGDEIYIQGVPVIEGTRAILSIALSRKGTTVIESILPLLRRNPRVVAKYQELGADIQELH